MTEKPQCCWLMAGDDMRGDGDVILVMTSSGDTIGEPL